MRETPNLPLANLTTLRIGGPARRVIEATTTDEVISAVRTCDDSGDPVLLIGGGSNLLIADEGFDGTVVRVLTHGIAVAEADANPETVSVTVAAGEDWDGFVATCVAAGHVGVEALSGIPGSTGATPIQNVGAYGQDVSATIAAVSVWDRQERVRARIAGADCGFSYRHSRFKGNNRYVILEVEFTLGRGELGAPVRYAELARTLGVEVGERARLAAVRETVLRLRGGKGMLLDPIDYDTWSAGSFFTNPILSDEAAERLPEGAPRFSDGQGGTKTSAAWLIEHAGFSKGYGLDRLPAPVSLSTKHTLALTNRGSATAEDLLALAREIRDGVRSAFGVELVPEPVLVGLTL